MPLHPSWSDIAVRLVCTLLAGVAFGLDRGEHGHAAGLRTTVLVSLAACVAMVQANLLLSTEGKAVDSFVNFDVMRLPLGILSGMGFIGAGAIIRREKQVLGVTTAAVLWFLTVLGLCFGGGQILLGLLGLLLGMLLLIGLRGVESRLPVEREATLTVKTMVAGPSDEEIRESLSGHNFQITSWGALYSATEQMRELTCELKWRAIAGDTKIPEIIDVLTGRPGVTQLHWSPRSR